MKPGTSPRTGNGRLASPLPTCLPAYQVPRHCHCEGHPPISAAPSSGARRMVSRRQKGCQTYFFGCWMRVRPRACAANLHLRAIAAAVPGAPAPCPCTPHSSTVHVAQSCTASKAPKGSPRTVAPVHSLNIYCLYRSPNEQPPPTTIKLHHVCTTHSHPRDLHRAPPKATSSSPPGTGDVPSHPHAHAVPLPPSPLATKPNLEPL